MILLLLSLAVGGLIVLGVTWHAGAGQIYSVAQIEAGLRQHPARWLGRTVQVRAVFVPGVTSCGIGSACVWIAEPMLVDLPHSALVPGAGSSISPAGRSLGAIALRSGQPNGLLTMLRNLPGIGRLLPGPAFSRPDTRYLVRLGEADPHMLCLQAPCFQATLIDGTMPARLPGRGQSAVTMVGTTLMLQPASDAAR